MVVFLVFLLLLLGFALCICGLLCGFVACCQEREMMGVHPIIYPKLVPCCPCKLSLVGWMAALSSCSSHLSFPRLGSPSQAKGMSHGASSQSSEMGRIHGLLCILVLMGWFLALVDLSGVNEGVGKALCCG